MSIGQMKGKEGKWHNGILALAIKKYNEIMPFATIWMDLVGPTGMK